MKNFFVKMLTSINDFIQNNLRIRFTKFITNLIPDKDITKTSILFYFIISSWIFFWATIWCTDIAFCFGIASTSCSSISDFTWKIYSQSNGMFDVGFTTTWSRKRSSSWHIGHHIYESTTNRTSNESGFLCCMSQYN